MRLGLRSIRRFTRVHPSGLPLARSPRMERERLRLLPRASHPTVTHDARQGGDDPFDTGPDHTLISSSLQSVSSLTPRSAAERCSWTRISASPHVTGLRASRNAANPWTHVRTVFAPA